MTSPDEPHEETAQLREEVERLRRQLQESPSAETGRTGWWRPLVAGVLIAVTAVLAPIAVVATWARDEIEDTDRYVETITPLASDPAVQQAIATRIEDVVFSYLDIDAITGEVVDALNNRDLPPRVSATLNAVSGPLASAIRGFISDRIAELVRSDLFQEAWIDANRTAHAQMVAVLTGEGTGAVQTTGGSVQVSIAPFVDALKQDLLQRGFTIADRIPEVQATFTIVQSAELTNAQTMFRLLDGIATWLPIIGLLMLAGAVLVARDRRRALLAAGLAIGGAMLLLGAALNLLRPLYLDAVPADALPSDAAASVYDTLVRFIRLALRSVLVVALTVAVAAWLTAPSGAGATARRGLASGIKSLRTLRSRAGVRTGAFGIALAAYRRAIRVGIIGGAALVYLLRDHPTPGYALGVLLVTVVTLVLVEVLAAPAEAVHEEAESSGP